MRIFALIIEPANYTFSIIRNVYDSRGIGFAFLKDKSVAGDERIAKDIVVISRLSFLKRLQFFWRILKEYDGFVLNGYSERFNAEFIALNLLFFKKPFAIESDTELDIPSNPVKRLLKRTVLGLLFGNRCCYGFPAGRFEHEKYFSYYGMSHDRIVMMPMVTESKNAEISIPHKPFMFGYVGRLITLKQVDKIIEAIRHVEGVELIVVGEGEEREKLELLASGLPVRFMGALFGGEKDRTIEKLDALILYSTHDQWGYVVNEALSLGKPVIVSDGVGCRHELVEGEGATGIVVDRNNFSSIVSAMSELVSDEKLYSELSGNALKRMSYWNFDLYNKQFDKWLERISK